MFFPFLGQDQEHEIGNLNGLEVELEGEGEAGLRIADLIAEVAANTNQNHLQQLYRNQNIDQDQDPHDAWWYWQAWGWADGSDSDSNTDGSEDNDSSDEDERWNRQRNRRRRRQNQNQFRHISPDDELRFTGRNGILWRLFRFAMKKLTKKERVAKINYMVFRFLFYLTLFSISIEGGQFAKDKIYNASILEQLCRRAAYQQWGVSDRVSLSQEIMAQDKDLSKTLQHMKSADIEFEIYNEELGMDQWNATITIDSVSDSTATASPKINQELTFVENQSMLNVEYVLKTYFQDHILSVDVQYAICFYGSVLCWMVCWLGTVIVTAWGGVFAANLLGKRIALLPSGIELALIITGGAAIFSVQQQQTPQQMGDYSEVEKDILVNAQKGFEHLNATEPYPDFLIEPSTNRNNPNFTVINSTMSSSWQQKEQSLQQNQKCQADESGSGVIECMGLTQFEKVEIQRQKEQIAKEKEQQFVSQLQNGLKLILWIKNSGARESSSTAVGSGSEIEVDGKGNIKTTSTSVSSSGEGKQHEIKPSSSQRVQSLYTSLISQPYAILQRKGLPFFYYICYKNLLIATLMAFGLAVNGDIAAKFFTARGGKHKYKRRKSQSWTHQEQDQQEDIVYQNSSGVVNWSATIRQAPATANTQQQQKQWHQNSQQSSSSHKNQLSHQHPLAEYLNKTVEGISALCCGVKEIILAPFQIGFCYLKLVSVVLLNVFGGIMLRNFCAQGVGTSFSLLMDKDDLLGFGVNGAGSGSLGFGILKLVVVALLSSWSALFQYGKTTEDAYERINVPHCKDTLLIGFFGLTFFDLFAVVSVGKVVYNFPE